MYRHLKTSIVSRAIYRTIGFTWLLYHINYDFARLFGLHNLESLFILFLENYMSLRWGYSQQISAAAAHLCL